MTELVAFTVVGLVIGATYAIAASGLVITYATSSVFNMAHGSVGMMMAFLYWELQVNRGVPTLLALFLVVFVAAPLFGAIVERTMMRRLSEAPVAVMLTVTVGLLVALIGLAQAIWPPGARRVDQFFPDAGISLGQVFVSGHNLLTFFLGLAVALALYVLLNRTRTGIAMRAIVDNRALVALHGARPAVLGALSWGLGSSLAALAGILIVSNVGLDYITLTLLVVNAYAAAMVGRLVNLPRTFVGAMLLGLGQEYIRLGLEYPPLLWLREQWPDIAGGLRAALPTIFLFVVMLLLPHEKLRVGRVTGASLVRAPSARRTLVAGAALIGAVVVLTGMFSNVNNLRLGQALAVATIMLSLVVLTGYGGDVSLGQMTFVGVGALVVARAFETVTPQAVLGAGVVAALVGALIAIPALRLRGLYLGLGTLAFAVAMDKLVFETDALGFQLGGSLPVERPVLFASHRAYTILLAVAFVAMAVVVLAIRRGRYGRFLLASRDSPAACGTLGLNITRTRVLVFAISAGMAGIGGALLAGAQQGAAASSFAMFQSLPLLLLAVVGGITSVTGALLGGLLLGYLPAVQAQYPALGGLMFLAIGAAAIGLGRNPNGIAGMLFQLAGRWRREPSAPTVAIADDGEEIVRREEVTVVGAP